MVRWRSLNGGNFIADAPDIALPYSATVEQASSTVPEPPGWQLCFGVLGVVAWRRLRSVLGHGPAHP